MFVCLCMCVCGPQHPGPPRLAGSRLGRTCSGGGEAASTALVPKHLGRPVRWWCGGIRGGRNLLSLAYK